MVTASLLPNSVIGSIGERVGEKYEIYDQNGHANLEKLLASIDARTVHQEPTWSNEGSEVDGAGRFTIYLPSFTSTRRDRFTVAHELGHYYLHHLFHDVRDMQVFARGGSNQAETEANLFAASLLMPTRMFRAQHELCRGNSWALAEVFGVSPTAAEIRAKVLGLGA